MSQGTTSGRPPEGVVHRRDWHAEAGSFFDVVPSDAAAHLSKHVIHTGMTPPRPRFRPRCV
jgi:hypothetical protein